MGLGNFLSKFISKERKEQRVKNNESMLKLIYYISSLDAEVFEENQPA